MLSQIFGTWITGFESMKSFAVENKDFKFESKIEKSFIDIDSFGNERVIFILNNVICNKTNGDCKSAQLSGKLSSSDMMQWTLVSESQPLENNTGTKNQVCDRIRLNVSWKQHQQENTSIFFKNIIWSVKTHHSCGNINLNITSEILRCLTNRKSIAYLIYNNNDVSTNTLCLYKKSWEELGCNMIFSE